MTRSLDTGTLVHEAASKNLVINGDFAVWQRGTSHSTEGYGSADRWRVGLSGATATFSRQSHTVGQTDVPFGSTFFAKYDVTTGDANTSIRQRIEDVTHTAGREITLSFYAKGVNPGGGNISLSTVQNFGSGGSPSTAVEVNNITTFTLTTSFQRFTHTFTLASITGKTLGTTENTNYFEISLRQPTADASTAAWNIDIDNVQVVFGDVPKDFEVVSPATQLARCQRYFERVGGSGPTTELVGSGFADGTINARIFQGYPTKRVIPTVTFSTQTGIKLIRFGTDEVATAIAAAEVGTKACRVDMTCASLTGGEGFIAAFTSSSEFIDVDAEL